jgi:hypothetical protein
VPLNVFAVRKAGCMAGCSHVLVCVSQLSRQPLIELTAASHTIHTRQHVLNPPYVHILAGMQVVSDQSVLAGRGKASWQ